jgi:hypothetical protein
VVQGDSGGDRGEEKNNGADLHVGGDGIGETGLMLGDIELDEDSLVVLTISRRHRINV